MAEVAEERQRRESVSSLKARAGWEEEKPPAYEDAAPAYEDIVGRGGWVEEKQRQRVF